MMGRPASLSTPPAVSLLKNSVPSILAIIYCSHFDDRMSRHVALCASQPICEFEDKKPTRPMQNKSHLFQSHLTSGGGVVRTPSSGVPHSVLAFTLFSARLAFTQSGVASSVRGLVMQSASFAARSV